MEPVQYKRYTILIKHYAAFRHNHREYPEIFDYIIFREEAAGISKKVRKSYSFNSMEDAITGAKGFIDKEEDKLEVEQWKRWTGR